MILKSKVSNLFLSISDPKDNADIFLFSWIVKYTLRNFISVQSQKFREFISYFDTILGDHENCNENLSNLILLAAWTFLADFFLIIYICFLSLVSSFCRDDNCIPRRIFKCKVYSSDKIPALQTLAFPPIIYRLHIVLRIYGYI